jgi:hypothetical protein
MEKNDYIKRLAPSNNIVTININNNFIKKFEYG